jgi:hypothetical protein
MPKLVRHDSYWARDRVGIHARLGGVSFTSLFLEQVYTQEHGAVRAIRKHDNWVSKGIWRGNIVIVADTRPHAKGRDHTLGITQVAFISDQLRFVGNEKSRVSAG